MRERDITGLSEADQEIVKEELALHERVKTAVRAEALATSPDMSVIQTRLKELRDEAISASERDLPALFQQMYTHHSLAARKFEKKLPDMRAPYFAHMRLTEKGRVRDILLGHQTFISSQHDITIIDWRHAALAKIFFSYREGDDYEIELPGRLAEGKVVLRRIITFDVGHLTAITGPRFSLVEEGTLWKRLDSDGLPRLAGGAGLAVGGMPFGTGVTKRKLPDVSALLDPEQYQILSQSESQALLILGGAGSGKTTVALHRMALLNYQRPTFYHPKAMRVVVPEQGLVRLTERLLRGLSLDDVPVSTFDHWVMEEGRHILKGLPKRINQWTPPAVIYVKRHPAMMVAVDRYLQKQMAQWQERAAFLLGDLLPQLVPTLTGEFRRPPWARLAEFEAEALKILKKGRENHQERDQEKSWKKTRAHDLLDQFLREARHGLLDVESARGALYTDPDLHQVLLEESHGSIKDSMIKELVKYTKRQFTPVESTQLDQDSDEGRAVDGTEIEEDDDAGTMDVEDFAVLLYLMQRVHGTPMRKGKSLTKTRHLLIDEAQDLAAIELTLLGQSLAHDGTFTIAGDEAQHSDSTVVFGGWEGALQRFGNAEVAEARLTTNYRCPRPIAKFGHQVLGPLAPETSPKSLREGQDVMVSGYPSEGLAIIAISEALAKLSEEEPLASIAVVCENQDNAQRFYQGLTHLDRVRLVIDGEFDFKPGIDVTDVSQVKGLEFDYVIIPDVSETYYPETPVARRTLHIAVTRTVHQLWVLYSGRRSALIPTNS